jgi:catechol 2,3-dioxygenase-like lactoylglutathione lyase family enzyme
MSAGLDRLLREYESGRLSRRDLLAALTAVFASTPRVASAERAPADPVVGPVKQMNHVSIFVPDVQKSKQFYQDVFGLPLLTNQDPGVNLSTGSGFLGIYPAQAGVQGGSINHLCLGVDNFDADGVLKKLTDRGLRARIRQRGDTKELYLTDPDGISVQLQDTKYIGGVGPLGDRKP